MILIISKNADSTTDLVIDWLYRWNLPFIRINDDIYHDAYVNLQNEALKINGIDISNFTVVWFRKNESILNSELENYFGKKLSKSFLSFHNNEAISFREFFFDELRKNKNLHWLTM